VTHPHDARAHLGEEARHRREPAGDVSHLDSEHIERERSLNALSLAEVEKVVAEGMHDLVDFDYLQGCNAVIVGDPEEVVDRCKAYEEAGVDLLLCLVNPYAPARECDADYRADGPARDSEVLLISRVGDHPAHFTLSDRRYSSPQGGDGVELHAHDARQHRNPRPPVGLSASHRPSERCVHEALDAGPLGQYELPFMRAFGDEVRRTKRWFM